jgi:hypothetical protein
MSCVEITPEMRRLLDACRNYPLGPEVLEQVRATPEWEQARKWGWVMETGELTGMGANHAGIRHRGILND